MVGNESFPVFQDDCRTAVGKGSTVLEEFDGEPRPKNDEKYVEVVRLNLGVGKEMMASGLSDVLRTVENGPFLYVARLRVIIAGVSVFLVDEASFSAGDEDNVEPG